MKNISNNEKGVTLIALVVTVSVLIILAGVATYSGIDTLRSAKLTAFTSELKIMQAKVNEYYEDYKAEETNTGIDYKINKIVSDGIGKEITNLTEHRIRQTFEGAGINDNEEKKHYVIVDKDCQKKMNVDGLKHDFLVNFTTRNVIALDGFNYKGKMYYTLDEGPGQVPKGVYNVDYKELTNVPTFNHTKSKNTDGTWTIKIEPVPFPGINKWYVEYSDEINGKKIKNVTEDLEIRVKGNRNYEVLIFNDKIKSEIQTISTKDESYVGCYADFENESGERIPDGKPDGIIFADLAVGNTNGSQWKDSDGEYTIPKIESGLKNYSVESEQVVYKRWSTEPKKMISQIDDIGEDRFYVMALEDLDINDHTWYINAHNKMLDYNKYTFKDFGTGEKNTKKMIARSEIEDGSIPNSNGDIPYGKIDPNDIWALEALKKEVAKGWFIPSKAEWSAFANELKISENSESKEYYVNHNLEYWYWSSSQFDKFRAYYAFFYGGCINFNEVNVKECVRLAKTF